MDLNDLAPTIMATMIPQARLSADDQAVLAKNQVYLAGLADDLISTFYEAAYGHGPTAGVFEEGERPAREKSLHDWWLRTVTEPIDDRYYAWMTLVGVIHIRRRVKNPMMLSMLGYITDYVWGRARTELDTAEADELGHTLHRLQNVVGSLISDSYTRSYIASLESLAGFTPELTERMLDIEIKRLTEEFRGSL